MATVMNNPTLIEALKTQRTRSAELRVRIKEAFEGTSDQTRREELRRANSAINDANVAWTRARDIRREGNLDNANAQYQEAERLLGVAEGLLETRPEEEATSSREAEEVAFRDRRERECESRLEEEQKQSMIRDVADRIIVTIPKVLAIIRSHNYADMPSVGLDRKIMTVDSEERAVWWVFCHEWRVSRNPMENYFILSDGTFSTHYGQGFSIPEIGHVGLHLDVAEGILEGLERIAGGKHSPRYVDQSPPTPAPKTEAKSRWERFWDWMNYR